MESIAVLITIIFGSFFTLFFSIWFFVLALVLPGIILWIFMLIDVIRRKFEKENDRTTWLLIVILTGVIGAIIYYVEIKRKDKK